MAEKNTASKIADTENLTHKAKDDINHFCMGGLCQVWNQPDNNFCNELIRDEDLESIINPVETSFANPALNAVMT
jgi:hypothetical protein